MHRVPDLKSNLISILPNLFAIFKTSQVLRYFLAFSFLFIAFSCTDGTSTDPGIDPDPDPDPDPDDPELIYNYSVTPAFPNLSFTLPLGLTHAGDGSDRLFVTEQDGIISVFANDSTVTGKQAFLDLSSKVERTGHEQGLLGLAFHPDYVSNDIFFVNYSESGTGNTIVSRFTVSSDPNQADPDSEEVLLEIEQPMTNHNGGDMVFGPDGYLYIAMGDGGGAGDPEGNGQDPTNLLGTILRIDVDAADEGLMYAIPSDNPFAGNEDGYREEIYAYGLRNPWRISFDSETGELWAADVGQSDWEEINIIESGKNYGWNVFEGSECFSPELGCNESDFEFPVFEYGHNPDNGSITGGYVYRGSALEGLFGRYIYADFLSGEIWAFDRDPEADPVNEEIVQSELSITAFGVSEDQELFICSFDGNIYRFAQEVIVQEMPEQE